MGWFILKHIFNTLFSFINIRQLSDQEKDLEILILRQQLSILQRKHKHPISACKIVRRYLSDWSKDCVIRGRESVRALRGGGMILVWRML